MSKSAYPDLVEALASLNTFGFTQLQASAYIAIVQLGGSQTGSAIAEKSGINRSKIYDTLGQLAEIGAVDIISVEGKNRYVAIPPDSVFDGLVQKFKNRLDANKAKLESLMEKQVVIDSTRMTMTRLRLDELDLNEFEYLISTDEACRSKLFEQVGEDNLPSLEVKILNLNNSKSAGLIMLLNASKLLVLPMPTGVVVNAIKIEDNDVAEFFTGIIQSHWTHDIPLSTQQDLIHGKLMGIKVGKSLYTKINLKARSGEFIRPVTYMITDTHLSFFYEGVEDQKIPLFALSDVVLMTDGSLELSFKGTRGEDLGNISMKPVQDSLLLRNLLKTLKRIPR